MRTCPSCGVDVPVRAGRGRPAVYCSKRCGTRARVARHRASKFPTEMQGRRWVRADGKRPVTVDGRPASTTDPRTWATLPEVRSAEAGDGMGVMLGQGLGCYDLDDVTVAEAREFAASIPERLVFAERSMSGRGVHLFVEAPEGRGSKQVVGGISVERYTRARFIRTTGRRLTL